jgi:hypothetical protein
MHSWGRGCATALRAALVSVGLRIWTLLVAHIEIRSNGNLLVVTCALCLHVVCQKIFLAIVGCWTRAFRALPETSASLSLPFAHALLAQHALSALQGRPISPRLPLLMACWKRGFKGPTFLPRSSPMSTPWSGGHTTTCPSTRCTFRYSLAEQRQCGRLTQTRCALLCHLCPEVCALAPLVSRSVRARVTCV